jgi:hypothetical protein
LNLATDLDLDSGRDFPVLLSNEQKIAAKYLAKQARSGTPQAALLEGFKRVIFALFTSQPHKSHQNCFHCPLEMFLIALSLQGGGKFHNANESLLKSAKYNSQLSGLSLLMS